MKQIALVLAALAALSPAIQLRAQSRTVVVPTYYERALRNPMKGFTHAIGHEWATLSHRYIRWNELEYRESDGLDRILLVSDQKFAKGGANNVKFIPRVYLHWEAAHEKYWPSDMTTDDYTSPQFQARVVRLIERLGAAWNDDPRVAFVELGIFGKWGEHHSPDPTPAMQALVGEAFHRAFPDKKVSVRHAWNEFQGFGFGEYWDSWGHYQQMWAHGQPIAELNARGELHLTNYIGGEAAYNWGEWRIQPGETPTNTVKDAVHREFMIHSIRWLHGTQLRWIAAYDQNDPLAQAGAEEIQKVMGYRFRLDSVAFDHTPDAAGLNVTLSVTNEGSAGFYYDWPVEVALHDPETRALVWRDVFENADIRTWTSGRDWTPPQWKSISIWPGKAVVDGWSTEPHGWGIPPATHHVSETFHPDIPAGEYVLTLAVLDPAGMVPSLRFATSQYWNGGRHPIGLVGVGRPGTGALPASFVFDDPARDASLHYDETARTPVGLERGSAVPEQVELGPNYPNPFNPSTRIPFTLADSGTVTMAVYSMLGRQVAVLLDREFISAGHHTVVFDASNLASGMYVVRMTTDRRHVERPIVLVK